MVIVCSSTHTVVHPSVKILAEGGGPINIEEISLAQEKAVIVNKTDSNEKRTLVIGDGNVFSIASCIQFPIILFVYLLFVFYFLLNVMSRCAVPVYWRQ